MHSEPEIHSAFFEKGSITGCANRSWRLFRWIVTSGNFYTTVDKLPPVVSHLLYLTHLSCSIIALYEEVDLDNCATALSKNVDKLWSLSCFQQDFGTMSFTYLPKLPSFSSKHESCHHMISQHVS